jgi:hypothetical protein
MRRGFITLGLLASLCLSCLPCHAALTLQQIGDAGTDDAWKSRIKARLLQDAFAVINESTGTTNHANRLLLAGNILREPNLWAGRFTVAVAGASGPASASSLAAVTDAQINTAVDSLLDGFASYAQ